MGSQTPEEKAVQEKIKNYYQILDTAFLLFDGKYDMPTLSNMPYKILIREIEREQSQSKEIEEIKAAQKLKHQLS